MNFGKRLREARRAKALTQPQLSELCGWGHTQSRVSMYERGQREPSYRELAKLADTLGVTIDWLVKGEQSGSKNLPEEVLRLAVLISQAPPKKAKAMLTLLGVNEGAVSPSPAKDPLGPSPTKEGLEKKPKDRRRGERRQNVQEADFERRAQRDRRAGAFVAKERTGKLSQEGRKEDEEKGKKNDE